MNEIHYTTEIVASTTANSWVDARCFIAVAEDRHENNIYWIDFIRRDSGHILDSNPVLFKNDAIAFLNKCHKKANTRKYSFHITAMKFVPLDNFF